MPKTFILEAPMTPERLAEIRRFHRDRVGDIPHETFPRGGCHLCELLEWKESAMTLLARYQTLADKFPAHIGQDRVEVLSRGVDALQQRAAVLEKALSYFDAPCENPVKVPDTQFGGLLEIRDCKYCRTCHVKAALHGGGTTRAEHLAWCKQRALQHVDVGDLPQAFASMGSDLGKHRETMNHVAIQLGAMLLFGGHLDTPDRMRKFIEGFN